MTKSDTPIIWYLSFHARYMHYICAICLLALVRHHLHYLTSSLGSGLASKVVGRVNEVNRRRARLVLALASPAMGHWGTCPSTSR